MVGGFQGSDGRPHYFGYFLVGHVFAVAHDEHRPLFVRKPGYCLGEFPLQRVPVHEWIFVYFPFELSGQAFELESGPDPFLAEMVQGFVSGYPVEPCVET